MKIAQHFNAGKVIPGEIKKPVKRATEVTEPGVVATGCEHSSWKVTESR
jgi:hypothetical protein